MLSGEVARYQIADRIREAEAAHRARSSRRGRALAARGRARRIASTAVALVLWPTRR
jgi:hypothetical protein